MNYGQGIMQMIEQIELEDKQNIGMDTILIEAGALTKLPQYLEDKQYEKVQVVVDAHTFEAAGKKVEALLKRSRVQINITFITPNAIGDVIADEASIVQLLLDIQQHRPQIVIAVGGGTLHDIVRYAALTSSLPFLSVPTAPSVDGFNSKGAPIIIRGYKKTIAAIGPNAIFADLDVLTRAPQPMVAAGFGDMIGKYTSLFDWRFGSLTNNEPFLEKSESITQQALNRCVEQVSLIAKRDEEGIASLTSALIESGVAMLMFGKSHPASGAEHHLSHFWEMEYIELGKKQLLHGAKVGVACIQIAKLYRRLKEEQFGIRGHAKESIAEHWQEIAARIERIPTEAELASLLSIVGGPTGMNELGVSDDLFKRSLQGAHLIRPERYTLLHAWNTSNQ